MAEDMTNFLDEVAGQGFENMGSQETATPLLLIAQAMSEVVAEGSVKVGNFYNSITGEDYGNNVKLVVIHFDKVWVEWKPNQGGFVGRHQVGSIPVTGDVYTGMKTAEGNDIVETWVYLVYLPEHPEAGYMVFQSTPGNIKYLKGWNTQMKFLRLPSGKTAPCFAAVWELTTGKDKSKNGNQYYSCSNAGKSSIKFVEWISQDTYTGTIAPARQVALQTEALAASHQEVLEDNSTAY